MDQKGPHVGTKRLIAYREGTLPAAERDAVQEHLSLCARCTGLLRELQDFEKASEPGPEALRQEAWDSLVRRLPPGEPAVRSIAGREGPRQRASRFVYAAAAALLLALIGFSIWSTVAVQQERRRLARLEQRLEEREQALAAARAQLQNLEREKIAGHEASRARVEELETRVAELTSSLEKLRRQQDRIAAASPEIKVSVSPLFLLRGQEPPAFLRGGATVNAVRLQDDRFKVALSLPDSPIQAEYSIELVDGYGKVLWSDRRLAPAVVGDLGTSITISGLGPGLYRLRITGPDRGELLGEYLLRVEQT